MKTLKYVSLMLIAFVFIMSCSGTGGKLKTQSENDSKVTQRELIDNWSDYNIWLSYSRAPELRLIVFDPKSDDRKILFGSNNWDTVKDQGMWTEIVKANTTSDDEFRMVWAGYDYSTTGVQEIWGPDNRLYGFIIYQKWMVEWVNVKLVDDNTMRLSWQRMGNQGAPIK